MFKNNLHKGKLGTALLTLSLGLFTPVAGSAAIGENDLTSQSYYEDALTRFNKGDYDGSIVQLKNVLQTSPSNLSAKILLGRAYLKSGNPGLAEQELSGALNRGADANVVTAELAEAQLQQGKLGVLIKKDSYPLLNLSSSVKSRLFTLMGIAHAKKGLMTEATHLYNEAALLDTTNTAPLLSLAALAFNQRDLQEAKRLLDKTDSIDPNLPDAWELRARISELEGDYENALELYNKTLELAPGKTSTITLKAEALISMGRIDQASKLIESIYDEQLFNPEVSYAYAMILSRQGKQSDAKLVLSTAHAALTSIDEEIKLANPKMLMLATMVAFQTKDYQSAIAQAYNALERYPALQNLKMILAESLIKVGRIDEALKTLEPISKQASAPLPLLALYGHALLLNQQYTEADRILEIVAKAAPDSPVILSDLGVAQLAVGKETLAEKTLSTAINIQPGVSQSGVILGLSQLDRGRPADAEKTALKMLASGDHPTSLNLLARAQLTQKKYTDAQSSLDKALRLAPDYVPAILTYANVDVAQNNLQAAQKRLKTAFDTLPQNIRLIGALANIAELQDDETAAINWLEKAVSINSGELALTLRLVDKYMASGQTEKHLALTERLIEETPESVVVYLARAKSYIAAQKLGYARSVLRKTLHFKNMSGDKFLEIANWQIQLNDISAGILSLNEAVTSYPDYLPARIELIKLEASLGNFNRAFELLKPIKAKTPNASGIVLLEADIHAVQGHIETAQNLIKKILSTDPTPIAVTRLSQIQNAAGEHKQATSTLETWLTKFPGNTEIKSNLALQYLLTNHPQKAINRYRELIALFPDESNFHNNIALAYLQLEDPAAISSAAKAYALAPKSALTLDTYGWVLASLGNPQEGIKLLREATARNASHPSIAYHLAATLAQLNQHNEARQILDPLLRTYNNFAEYSQAQNLLKTLHVKNRQ